MTDGSKVTDAAKFKLTDCPTKHESAEVTIERFVEESGEGSKLYKVHCSDCGLLEHFDEAAADELGWKMRARESAFEFDFGTLTPAQLRVFGAISINNDLGHHDKVLHRLEELTLIERHTQNTGGFPPMKLTRWTIPVAVHIAWCYWCEKNYDDEGNRK
jgi:hypothetical protein